METKLSRHVSFDANPPEVFETPKEETVFEPPKCKNGKDIKPEISRKETLYGPHGETLSPSLTLMFEEQQIIAHRIDKVESKLFKIDEKIMCLEEKLLGAAPKDPKKKRKVSFGSETIMDTECK